ncbi:DUF4037 domain-containing protein [Paenibacillus sepulcri]
MLGIELCRRFYAEIVEPVMDTLSPVSYSATLIGPGSEVLGFDTEMSRDHDWGPRVYLFLHERDLALRETIRALLDQRVPPSFYGFPIDIKMTVITTVPNFIRGHLATDITRSLELVDWLTFPSQNLLEITRGEVFRDDDGQLSALRHTFAFYPRDIWLYLMASGWQRIGQEEHLMHRSGFVGDELGSAVIGSRVVRDIMNLCFLMEGQYAPYPKWFGTAFRRLKCSDQLLPCLLTAQTTADWRERELALNEAYSCLSQMHNGLGISENIPADASMFYDRPFKVMNGERVAGLIAGQIADSELQQLAQARLIGGIDQITDNTDFRKLGSWPDGDLARNALKTLFKPLRK